ncbi:MAG: hypothetical protein FWG06_00165 [Clostridiales bacterium]|nr:hypothetical protein [Clostridiales bacterium]
MTCRCKEIQKCGQDIRLLESDMARELNAAQQTCDLCDRLISSLGKDLAAAAFVGDMARIETRLAAMKKNQEGRISNAQAKRCGESARIRGKRAAYENEDRRHHEMLKQRG